MAEEFSPEDIAALMGGATAPSQPAPAGAPVGDHGFSQEDVDALTKPVERVTPKHLVVSPDEQQGATGTFVRNALNTGLFNLPKNAEAAYDYYTSKPGQYDSFEQAFQHRQAVESHGDHNHPYAATAGKVAGVGGAVLAAPYVLPEAGMAALYAGGIPAIARSAAIGGALTGGATYADTHDARKAAVGTVAGAVAGPVADKVVNTLKPFYRTADGPLVAREFEAAFGKGAEPGSPAWWRNDMLKGLTGQAAGSLAGAGAGYAAGQILPFDYGPLGTALGGAALGRQAVKSYQDNRRDLGNMGQFYPKGNRGAALVGAALPQVFGLLGDDTTDSAPLQITVRPNNR